MPSVLAILVNLIQISSVIFGGPLLILGLMHLRIGTQSGMKRIFIGAVLCAFGLITPAAPVDNLLPPVDYQILNGIASIDIELPRHNLIFA